MVIFGAIVFYFSITDSYRNQIVIRIVKYTIYGGSQISFIMLTFIIISIKVGYFPFEEFFQMLVQFSLSFRIWSWRCRTATCRGRTWVITGWRPAVIGHILCCIWWTWDWAQLLYQIHIWIYISFTDFTIIAVAIIGYTKSKFIRLGPNN